MSAAYHTHLKRIQLAKEAAQAALAKAAPEARGEPAHPAAQASMNALWELFFETLQRTPGASIEDLKECTTVIQRMTAAYHHIASLHLKQCPPEAAQAEPKDQPLTPEVLRQIEARLNLL
jgi:hypothetical protein